MKTNSRIYQIITSGFDFKNHSLTEISEYFNYDYSKLRKTLIKQGIPYAKKNPKHVIKSRNKIKQAIAMTKEGKTRTEIATALKVNVKWVSTKMNDVGIKMKTQQQIGFAIAELHNDVIVGSLLGDGCITYGGGKNSSCRLNFHHSIVQLSYMQYKAKLLGYTNIKYQHRITRGLRFKGRENESTKFYHAVSFHTKSNGTLNKYRDDWYKNKDRQVPLNLKLTPLSLAIWFMDDGTTNEYQCCFCTNSFNKQSCDTLVNSLHELNLNARVRKINKNSDQLLVYLNADSILRFIKIVLPHMHKSMIYKLYNLKKWRIYCELTGTPLEFNPPN